MMTEEQKTIRKVFDDALALMQTEQKAKGDVALQPEDCSQGLREKIDVIKLSVASLLVAGRVKKSDLNALLALVSEPSTVDAQLAITGAVFSRELKIATHGLELKHVKLADPHDPIRGFKTLAAAHAINGSTVAFNEQMYQPTTVAMVYNSGVNVRTLMMMYQSCGGLSLTGLRQKLEAHDDKTAANNFMDEVKADEELYADYIRSKLFSGRAGDTQLSFMALPYADQIRFYQTEADPLAGVANKEQQSQLVKSIVGKYDAHVAAAVADAAGEYQAVIDRANEAAEQAREAIYQITRARAALDRLDNEAAYIASQGNTGSFVTRQHLLRSKKAFEIQKSQQPVRLAEIHDAQRSLLKAYAVLQASQEIVEKKKDKDHNFSSLLNRAKTMLLDVREDRIFKSSEELAKRNADELKRLNEAQAMLDAANTVTEENFALFDGNAEGSFEAFEQAEQQGQGAAYIKQIKQSLLTPESEEEKVGFGAADDAHSDGDVYAIEVNDRWVRLVPWGTGHAMVSVDTRNSPLMRLHNIPNDTNGQIKLAFEMIHNFQKLREKVYYDKALEKAKTAKGDAFDRAVFEGEFKNDPELQRIIKRPIYLRCTIDTQRSSEMHRVMLAVCKRLDIPFIEDNVKYVEEGLFSYNPLRESQGFSGWFDRHRLGVGYYTEPTQSDFDHVDRYLKNNQIPCSNGNALSAKSLEEECNEDQERQALYTRTLR